MQGLPELAPSVVIHSRHRPVERVPFLVYLHCSSSSLALLRMVVLEKSIFRFFFAAGDDNHPSGFSTSMSITFP